MTMTMKKRLHLHHRYILSILSLALCSTCWSQPISPGATVAKGAGGGGAAAAAGGAANGDKSGSTLEKPLQIFTNMDSNHDHVLSENEFLTNFHLFSNGSGTGSSTFGSMIPSSIISKDFWNGFSSSTMMIIATEIGDKTFFIAAVLSMRNSRLHVFLGALSALICMTILSTMMGLILPSFLPKQYTHILGGILFLYFGIKLIYDSRSMEDKVSDELEEVEEELLLTTNKKKEENGTSHNDDDDASSDIELQQSQDEKGSSLPPSSSKQNKTKATQNILLQGFILTFLAEWGDRSQIATIALAAAKNPYGVTVGGCFGHALCTGMACVGGRMLASQISERTVSLWGGIIFLGFGIHSFFFEL